MAILIKTNRGMNQVENSTSIYHQDLKYIKYALSSSTKELSLILSKISKILAFKGYVDYLEDKGEKVEDYLAIEKDNFDTFRNLLVTYITASSITLSKPADLFKKVIKRDATMFNTSKEDNQ